jgi:hypothetical protein
MTNYHVAIWVYMSPLFGTATIAGKLRGSKT